MEKLVLFPLNNDTEVLINNLERNDQYKIVAVSSYYEDKKRLEALGGKTSFYCNIDFVKCLEKADTVIFAENTMGYSYEGYKERVQQAEKLGKKIYASTSLLNKIEIDLEKSNLSILKGNKLSQDLNEEKSIKEIDVPVVSIMGMGENCDKFNLQVKVKRMIEKQGYKVLTVSSNVLGKFLGMEILPEFLFSLNMSYPEKIKNFKLWIYQLQRNKRPDIILIGCPGGISEFIDYESNFYGEIPLVISNSISIDIGLITLYANMAQNTQTSKKLNEFSLMKYNTEVTSFIFSRQYFKIDDEWRKIRYYRIDREDDTSLRVDGIMEHLFSYIGNDQEIEEIVRYILDQLQNNLYVI